MRCFRMVRTDRNELVERLANTTIPVEYVQKSSHLTHRWVGRLECCTRGTDDLLPAYTTPANVSPYSMNAEFTSKLARSIPLFVKPEGGVWPATMYEFQSRFPPDADKGGGGGGWRGGSRGAGAGAPHGAYHIK